MVAHIQFLKMDRSESAESFVADQLQSLMDFISHKDVHFRVWLECLNSQIQAGQDEFRCAIEIEGLKRKHYFSEKKDENFYQSVIMSVEALKKMLRREKKIFRSLRKKSKSKFKKQLLSQAS